MIATTAELAPEWSSVPYKRPFHFDVGVETMQERLAIATPPVAPNSREKLVAIHRTSDADGDSATDLIGLSPQSDGDDGPAIKLVHFYQDPASASGWSHIQHPVPPVELNGDPAGGGEARLKSTEVRALHGFHQNGITYLFVHYRLDGAEQDGFDLIQVLYATYSHGRPQWARDAWCPDGPAGNLLSAVRQLSIHRRPDDTHLIYGLSRGYGPRYEQFFVVFPTATSDDGMPGSIDLGFAAVHDHDGKAPNWREGQERGHSYQIAELPSDELNMGSGKLTWQFELLRCTEGSIEFHRMAITGVNGEDAALKFEFEPNAFEHLRGLDLDLREARIRVAPLGSSEAMLLHQPGGHLGLIRGYHTGRAELVPLTSEPGQVVSLTKVNQLAFGTIGRLGAPDSQLVMFASDDEGLLWVREFTRELNQSKWAPMGHQIDALACPRVTASAGEVFFAGPQSNQVIHKVRNTETSTWITQEVATSTTETGKIEPITAHVFDIQMTDDNGLAVCNHELVLTCGAPALLYVDGIARRVGPGRPLTLRTAAPTGRIRAVIRAAGLTAPDFQVRPTNDDAVPTSFRPNTKIAQRLAGNAKGYCVQKKIRDEKHEYGPLLQEVVKHYGEAACKANDSRPCDGTSRGQYRLSLQNGVFEKVKAGEEIPQVNTQWPFSFGDAMSFLGNAFHKISSVIVKVLQASVIFVVEIAGRTFDIVGQFFDNIADSFMALGRMLESLFEKIGRPFKDLLDKIIEWVSFIFEGSTVFAVNDVIKAAIKGHYRCGADAIVNGADRINKAYQKEVGNVFNHIKKSVKDHSGDGKGRFKEIDAKGFRINGENFANPSMLGHVNRAGADITGSLPSKMSEAEVLFSQGMKSVPEDEIQVLEDLLDKIKVHYKDNVEPDKEAFFREARKDGTLDKWKANPFEALDVALDILKTVCEGLGDLFAAAVKVVEKLLSRLLSMLDEPLGIDALDRLAQLWSGDPGRRLTRLDVVTLPIAFVGTAVWKAVTGKSPLTRDQCKKFVDWVGNDDKGPIDILAVLDRSGKPVGQEVMVRGTDPRVADIPPDVAEVGWVLQVIVGFIISLWGAVTRVLMTMANIYSKTSSATISVIGVLHDIATVVVAGVIEFVRLITVIVELVTGKLWSHGKQTDKSLTVAARGFRIAGTIYGFLVGLAWSICTILCLVLSAFLAIVGTILSFLAMGLIFIAYTVSAIFGLITVILDNGGKLPVGGATAASIAILGGVLSSGASFFAIVCIFVTGTLWGDALSVVTSLAAGGGEAALWFAGVTSVSIFG